MVVVRLFGEFEEKRFEVGEDASFPFDYVKETEMFRISIKSDNYLMIPREAVMYIYYLEQN